MKITITNYIDITEVSDTLLRKIRTTFIIENPRCLEEKIVDGKRLTILHGYCGFSPHQRREMELRPVITSYHVRHRQMIEMRGIMSKERPGSCGNDNVPQEKCHTWSLRNGGRGTHYRDLPKCQATAKHSGQRCKSIAMKGKRVCYFHGGKSTGPKTERGKLYSKYARLRHGDYSARVKKNMRNLMALSRLLRLRGLL